jgi:hypothetical protein
MSVLKKVSQLVGVSQKIVSTVLINLHYLFVDTQQIDLFILILLKVELVLLTPLQFK